MQSTSPLLVSVLALAFFAGGVRPSQAADQTQYPPGVEKLVAQNSPLRDGDKIVFFGDSITQQGGYHKLIAKALKEKRPNLDVAIINAGISGHKVPDLQARIERDVLSKKPTVVFIYIGINDVWHSIRGQGTPKDKYEAGLREIIGKLKKAGATVILATPTTIGEKPDGTNPLDPMLEQYAAISRQVAKEEGVKLCDLRVAFIDYLKKHNKNNVERGILTTDGVHMKPAGDALLADKASACIVSALQGRK
jgi:lysophospholipase L1-like esterase